MEVFQYLIYIFLSVSGYFHTAQDEGWTAEKNWPRIYAFVVQKSARLLWYSQKFCPKFLSSIFPFKFFNG